MVLFSEALLVEYEQSWAKLLTASAKCLTSLFGFVAKNQNYEFPSTPYGSLFPPLEKTKQNIT